MRRRIVRSTTGVALVLLICVLAGCGSAPTKDLWYVHFGAQCPKPNTGVDTNNPAGFTSVGAARTAARIETKGPRIYWQAHLVAAKQQLNSARTNAHLSASARAAAIKAASILVVEYRTLLGGYAHCTKYVVKGVPPPSK